MGTTAHPARNSGRPIIQPVLEGEQLLSQLTQWLPHGSFSQACFADIQHGTGVAIENETDSGQMLGDTQSIHGANMVAWVTAAP